MTIENSSHPGAPMASARDECMFRVALLQDALARIGQSHRSGWDASLKAIAQRFVGGTCTVPDAHAHKTSSETI